MNNLKFKLEEFIEESGEIESLFEHAKFYAEQNYISKGEIAAVLRLTYDSMKRKIEDKKT